MIHHCPRANKHLIAFSRLILISEGEKRNENPFTSVRVDISNDINLQAEYEKDRISRGTHCICNFKKMKHV